ncbi:MAG TPA: hypothetical protein VGG72_35265 [Bryobacteraceae bacterium]|jgi:hypothetical protein
MNENDLDRYFWRTGQRWGGSDRDRKTWPPKRKIAKGTIILLFAAFAATVLYLMR